MDLALNHEEKLQKAMRKIWFNDKYKFYSMGGYWEDIQLAKDTYRQHQFVSINQNGDVLGYISYTIDRGTNSVYDFGIVGFADNKIIFGNDIKTVIKNIFKQFNKINFYVVVGNPVEKMYDRFIEKYGGRICGYFCDNAKLTDGKLYDTKCYEILANEWKG